jgi:hypothetical protein
LRYACNCSMVWPRFCSCRRFIMRASSSAIDGGIGLAMAGQAYSP